MLHWIRIGILLALLLLLGWVPTWGQPAPTEERGSADVDLLLVGGQRFDTEAGLFRPNTGLAIRAGRFVALEGKEPPRAARTIELNDDQYILPGIVDCHAHYNVRLIRKRREEFEVTPVVYLANGATVTFSCGEFDPEGMLALRKRIDAGTQIGPRLLNSGPYFGRARPGWDPGITPEGIHAEVDFWAAQGVGGFKAKAISASHLRPLIERAHHHGLTVTGHLDSGFRSSVNPRDAIEMGIDRIEHFLGGDAMPDTRSAYASLPRITADMPEFKEIVQIYVDRGVWFDATITAYGYFGVRGEEYEMWEDERSFFTPLIQARVKDRTRQPVQQFEQIYQAKQKTISAFHEAGGKITLGTDHFSDGEYLPGFGVHRELDALVRNGIPAADAIRIATINGAKALGIDADHGSIEPGKSADLFVITGDPLEQIRRTRNVQWVMTRGRLYDSQALLESVRGKLGPQDESEMGAW